ncbi:MAG: hypothetical protein AAF299_07000 [Pseudomonadota bacterium]
MNRKTIPLPGNTFACTRNMVAALAIALVTLTGPAQAGDGVRIPVNLCSWEVMGWRDLNGSERLAWAGLGWTMRTWHHDRSDNYPASYGKSWAELADTEKLFAGKLGFNQQTWDTEECPNYSVQVRQARSAAEQAGTTGSAD